MRDKNKRAQVTIFIIIAIVIVAGVLAYFVLSGKIGQRALPQELSPVYNYFLSCIEDETESAVLLMSSQGGHIDLPVFEPGSAYAPFSSQLDFLGTPVPYWYYVSGNGIVKQQVPSKALMEQQLENYIQKNVLSCSFSSFTEQGFEVDIGEEASADVSIKDNKIDISVSVPLNLVFGEISAVRNKHNVGVSSRLGKFYTLAQKIYDSEQKNLFLEEYGIDVLRLYTPVDGVELTCSPKIWLKQEIENEFRGALEANIQSIKIKGDYYSLANQENKYFVQDLGQNLNEGESINLLYSGFWPTKFDVYPEEDPMIAKPVGNQAGLGLLGFCYVPYHFVYDVSYPVLIQIYDSEEMFQFPIAVVIDKNLARKGLEGEAVGETESELCKYKNQEIEVYTYNTELDAVEADIDFECLGQRCALGKTQLADNNSDAYLSGFAPQCANGFIVAEADGYARKRYQVSTNTENSFNIILDKLHNLTVELRVDDKLTSDYAIIDFISEDGLNSQTVAWPDQQEIKLSEGQYDVRVYVYKNSSIKIPALKDEKCVESPKAGILGLFGQTEEKCFPIEIPAQELSNVVSGGGKGQDYLVESELEKGKIVIKVQSIPLPKSLEELQDSYNLLEVKPVYLEFENA